jgi:predicted PolB exonuclease-like 3'-5' exonuclease
VAICGEWFNGHGTALHLGKITDQKNHEIVKKVQNSFENWMNDGKIDSFNQEVVLMCVKLSKATLYNDGKRFDHKGTEPNFCSG